MGHIADVVKQDVFTGSFTQNHGFREEYGYDAVTESRDQITFQIVFQ